MSSGKFRKQLVQKITHLRHKEKELKYKKKFLVIFKEKHFKSYQKIGGENKIKAKMKRLKKQ